MLVISLIICCNLFLQAEYSRPKGMNKDAWEKLVPYFLPEDHPIKEELDLIFDQKTRPTLSPKTFKKAGFSYKKIQGVTRVIVAKHPKMTGYVVKAYLDAHYFHNNRPEYISWYQRIIGADLLRQLIATSDLTTSFKVP